MPAFDTMTTMLTGNTFQAVTASEAHISGRRVVRAGTWFRTARVHDELWIEGVAVPEPSSFIEQLKRSGLNADLFTFAQALPEIEPRYDYHLEWDNISVTETRDYEAWWTSLPQESRKNVRRSQRRGVTVKLVELDDALISGIQLIYDETPIRQGRRFWHYRKPLETIRQENSSYLDRSHFVGAFFEDKLVGFVKLVRVGATARFMQILSLSAHYDKRPTNALLAKSIEICAQSGISHLIYGQHIYDNKVDSSITEFKNRNGFKQVLLPRYYIPLTNKGRVGLSLGLHHGFKHKLPLGIREALFSVRMAVYQRMAASKMNVCS